MLNVGGSVPRQGPLVRGLTIAFNKCPPLLGRNQWLPMLDKIRNGPHVGIVATYPCPRCSEAKH